MSNTREVAFQDQIPGNHCFGCGPDNEGGLRIKSYWSGEDEAECRFLAQPHHNAGPVGYLNGGIISTLIDCHAINTALAKAYQLAGREMGTGEQLWCVTGSLEVRFENPVPIDREVLLIARIEKLDGRKTHLRCDLSSDGVVCARGSVLSIQVRPGWFG